MAKVNLSFWLSKKTNYDDFAEDFDATRQNPWTEFEKIRDFLHGKILDAGCGNGRLFDFLKDKKTSEYFGIDASPKMISAARRNFPEANFKVGKIENLHFKNHEFDAVAAIASFPHLPNEKKRIRAFSEFFRVLKPGGKLILTSWNLNQERFETEKSEAKKRAKKYFWWNENDFVIPFGTQKIPRLYRKLSETDLKEYAKNTGFENISVEDSGRNLILIAQKPTQKEILGIPIDATTFAEALEKMQNENGFFITPNPEILVEASRNAEYKKVLRSAYFSVPDGIGLLWAVDFLNQKKTSLFLFSLFCFLFHRKSSFFPERVTGSDLFRAFCKTTTEKVFLLGGAKNAAKICAEKFGKNFFWDDGSRESFDENRICQNINESGATVLFVAFGAPWQELWIARNRTKLPNIRLFMGVGGSFDFLAGAQKRAPLLFRKTGLEWLYRLLREPRKRGGRILTAVWTFPRKIVSNQ